MGVYIPKRKDGGQKSPFYHYDFVLKPKGSEKSQRFHGSTGQRTKKAAERVEAKIRELAALGQLNVRTTVDDACTRYWEEHLIRARGADDQATILEHLCEFYGRETPIVAISPDEVAKAAVLRCRSATLSSEYQPMWSANTTLSSFR